MSSTQRNKPRRPSVAERNKLGQLRGAKGTRTRERIMEATRDLLRTYPFGDIRITDIARVAEITQPNFYTYFTSVADVVEALVEKIAGASAAASIAALDWEGPDGIKHARALVEEFIEFWRENGAVIQVVDLFADNLHGRFPQLRVRLGRDIYKAFEAKIRKQQAAGVIAAEINPRLCGYQCFTLLSTTSARYNLFLQSGFRHQTIVETTARTLLATVTGVTIEPSPQKTRQTRS